MYGKILIAIIIYIFKSTNKISKANIHVPASASNGPGVTGLLELGAAPVNLGAPEVDYRAAWRQQINVPISKYWKYKTYTIQRIGFIVITICCAIRISNFYSRGESHSIYSNKWYGKVTDYMME